jgi:hypothetical protein
MINHAIGDGDKQIMCPDRYLVDSESDTTTVIWDPEQVDIPIRVTIITVTPKDSNEHEAAYWDIIKQAQKRGLQPKVIKDKSLYTYREKAKEDGYIMHFFKVGMGNHCAIFSICVASSEEYSQAFNRVKNDLENMIESLVERGKGEQFDCGLQEGEKEAIGRALTDLLKNDLRDQAWSSLQQHYDRALQSGDQKMSAQIGLVFGELIRQQVPSFHWAVKIDEYGRSKSLDFEKSGVVIFPEDMIVKRINRKEGLNLQELSSDTIETAENLFRKNQSEG